MAVAAAVTVAAGELMQAWFHYWARSDRPRGQGGQVMVLFAISLLVLVMAVGLAIDGGFGLLQYRQAQNAADFAAEGVAQALSPQCTDNGVMATGTQVVNIVNELVSPNSPSTTVTGIPFGWTGYYLNGQNQPMTGAGGGKVYVYDTVTGSPTTPPLGACGVHLNVTPQWPPFVEQIVGVAHLNTAAGASALNPATPSLLPIGIEALAENGAHDILMAGDGNFDIWGDIYDNANGCLNYSSPQRITGGCQSWGGMNNPDILDGKQSGTMYVWGKLKNSNIVNTPWDWCFGSPANSPTSTATPSPWPPPVGTPPAVLPGLQAACGANNTSVYTDSWGSTHAAPVTTDPLAGLVTPPTPSIAGCGLGLDGVITQADGTTPYFAGAYPNPTVVSGNAVIYPGQYRFPVVVTGNAVFANCSQESAAAGGTSGAVPPAPGIFYFDQGLAIRPQAGSAVTGQDILLVTQNPLPNGAITLPSGGPDQNVGDGEPAIGAGSGNCGFTSDAAGKPSGETCAGPYLASVGCPNGPAGTNCNSDANGQCSNSVCFAANPVASQGLNDALQMGGNGTINLTAPQDGPYQDFLTWQVTQANAPVGSQPLDAAVRANVGFDSLLGDSANITLTGTIVDNSDQQGQNPSNEQYWGGNSSLPFIPGGMLVTGFGIASDPAYPADASRNPYGSWGTGFTCGAGQPGAGTGCQVNITGLAMVDMFQTQGKTQLSIKGEAPAILGASSSAILTG